MAAFEYAALDPAGKERRGVLEGDSARGVRQQLRDQGWIPLDVEEVAERRPRAGALGTRRTRASSKELTLFTRQLATLLGAGSPLEEALRAAARQTEKASMRNLVTGIRARVVEGHSLAEGLAQFPRAFSELYRATVAAGEHSGHLDQVLERLADYTERRHQMRQTVAQALVYPILLLVVSVAVVIALLTFVVPKITRVFEDTGQTLPPLTRALIGLSGFLREYGIWLALAAAAVVVGFGLALRRPAFRRQVHTALLRLPLIGSFIRGLNTARFARTLSILAGSGVQVLEALRIAAEVISNIPMREAVTDAAVRIREGTAISTALERSGQFPPMMVHLIASGEGSGRLEEMLERAADTQEREVEATTGVMVSVLGPAAVLIMGVVVLLIVMAMLQPIFQMNSMTL
ncbi:MAG TPA: type II secretion system inner membrane protein GspF [Gammaproteobacteria bacterium]|nr:type II secretion system inner membrane protein GspF [Gammaproteobacteria bacterium]